MKLVFLIFFTQTFFVSCAAKQFPEIILTKSLETADSLLIVKYKNQVIRSFAAPEDSLLTTDSILKTFYNALRVEEGNVTYAPDSSFKIVTIIAEHCGASCHPEFISWIHYNLKGKEIVDSCNIDAISNIYMLPNRNYLILHSWQDSRFRSFYVNHISFNNNKLIQHPIRYKNEFNFSISGDNDFDTLQGIWYNEKQRVLSYNYIKRNDELNIDTIRQGQFSYTLDNFMLEKEKVIVTDNRVVPVKKNEWTEIYQNTKNDTFNINLGIINDCQLVCDYVPLNNDKEYLFKNVKISAIKNNSKKELFATELSLGSFFSSISLLTIQGNHFVYFQTNETSGNSDGYLYYINEKTMEASEVKIDKSDTNFPKGIEPIGSYAYKAINEDRASFFTSSNIVDTKSGKRGLYIVNYKLQQINTNQFILKAQKPSLSFND